jgi:hypothetical protein
VDELKILKSQVTEEIPRFPKNEIVPTEFNTGSIYTEFNTGSIYRLSEKKWRLFLSIQKNINIYNTNMHLSTTHTQFEGHPI